MTETSHNSLYCSGNENTTSVFGANLLLSSILYSIELGFFDVRLSFSLLGSLFLPFDVIQTSHFSKSIVKHPLLGSCAKKWMFPPLSEIGKYAMEDPPS